MGRIEKIGTFYLGREYDLKKKECSSYDVMYDSRDLTTHAVCVGMTGSGKTGLCINLLEEAALDGIPAIILDPKGDITNLLLTFPNLLPEDFKPWINVDDARRKNLSVEEYAEQISLTWRNGLAEWDQTPDRIKALRDGTEFSIFTPGSDAGVSLSVLSALAPPDMSWETDAELIREQIQGVVNALLGLMGLEADPLQSREYILLSSIIEHHWRNLNDLDLPLLVTSVQNPPMKKLGVLDVDLFFPEKDRFKFAVSLNNIIASPGFQSWLTGEPLDIASLLHTSSGKPRHSIIYLAHLTESQRMFFVTLLLERVVSWMRTQSGTTSLRALLYFDEVFGFLPPVAEPPSKRPLLTLLKQARAFGLGIVLTTQNPVDLDYKGLSNAGTWFVGRLQTDTDKNRLLDGLESISRASGTGFSRIEISDLISSLGSRVFLLHNVHGNQPVVFQTRWVMSYLRGPLTRDQIRILRRKPLPGEESHIAPPEKQFISSAGSGEQLYATPQVLPQGVPRVYLPLGMSAVKAHESIGFSGDLSGKLVYEPALFALGTVSFQDTKRSIAKTETRSFLVFSGNRGVTIGWAEAAITEVKVEDLSERAEPDSMYSGSHPREWTTLKDLKAIAKNLSDFIYGNSILEIPYNPALDLSAFPGESASDFSIRCREKAREQRDAEVEKLRVKTAALLDRLQTKLEKEERELEEDRSEYKGRQNEEMLSAGETIAGMLGLFGRRRTSGLSSAARKRRLTASARADIKESEEEIRKLEDDISELEEQVKGDAGAIAGKWETALEENKTLEIKPRRTDVQITLVAPAWAPFHFIDKGDGTPPVRVAAWKCADPLLKLQ